MQLYRVMVWDAEPRGVAVKGHGSRVQGKGEQGGRENNTLIFTDLEPCVPVELHSGAQV